MVAVSAEQTRPFAIKRFLSKPPKGAHKLTLTAQAVGTTQELKLGTWSNDDGLTPELVDLEIIPLLDETSQEMNASLVAVLTFWTASEQKLTEKVVQRSNVNVQEHDTLASTAGQLTGDYTSQATQAQKHLEVMAKLYLNNLNGLFALQRQAQEHTMELCDRLASRVVDAERKAERASAEKDELVEVMTRVEESQGQDSEVSVAQSQMMQQLAPFLPQIIAGVMRALGSGPALPPQTPSE